MSEISGDADQILDPRLREIVILVINIFKLAGVKNATYITKNYVQI